MIIVIISLQKVLGTRSQLDIIRYLDDIEITHILRNWFIRDYSWVPDTTRVLINGGGGGNPSKKLMNGGVLIKGGSEIRKKRVFTLSTGDKCNNYSKQLQVSKNKNVYHFYTFDKKNSFFNCF